MKKSMFCLLLSAFMACNEPTSELSGILENNAVNREKLCLLRDEASKGSDSEYRMYQSQIDKIDEKNFILLKQTLDSLKRWPNRSELSSNAMNEFCQIFKRTHDVEFINGYISYFYDAFNCKNIKGEIYADVVDQLASLQGKPQVYGTFLFPKPSLGGKKREKSDVWPIEDYQEVDKRRTAIGLESFQQFLKNNSYSYNEEDVKLLFSIFPTGWDTVDTSLINALGWDKVLSSLYDEDQNIRKDLFKALFASDDKLAAMLSIKTVRISHIHLQSVERYLMERKSWPTANELSNNALKGLFFVYQHAASLAFYERYYPLIESAFKKGEIDGYFYALATDRLLMFQGKPQLYGTQLISAKTHKDGEVYQVKNIGDIDKLRKQVGLKPFDEYLKENNYTYNAEER